LLNVLVQTANKIGLTNKEKDLPYNFSYFLQADSETLPYKAISIQYVPEYMP
jgi:hypothetical protein